MHQSTSLQLICRTCVIHWQEVGWFDLPENQAGALTGRLAADVPMLQNITGRRLSSMLEMLVILVVSLVIAFCYSWQIALISLAFFPVLALAGALEVCPNRRLLISVVSVRIGNRTCVRFSSIIKTGIFENCVNMDRLHLLRCECKLCHFRCRPGVWRCHARARRVQRLHRRHSTHQKRYLHYKRMTTLLKSTLGKLFSRNRESLHSSLGL